MQFYDTFDHLPTPPIEAQMPVNSMPPSSKSFIFICIVNQDWRDGIGYPYGVYPGVSAAPGIPAPAAPEQVNDSSALVSKIQVCVIIHQQW